MARFYALEGAFHALTEGLSLPPGAVEVPRLPVAGEVWDGRGFVLDKVLLADLEASPAHVERAHQQKLIEALLIKSGVELTAGLLAAEAPLRGVDMAAMADLVLDAAGEFIATESKRMTDKIDGASATNKQG